MRMFDEVTSYLNNPQPPQNINVPFINLVKKQVAENPNLYMNYDTMYTLNKVSGLPFNATPQQIASYAYTEPEVMGELNGAYIRDRTLRGMNATAHNALNNLNQLQANLSEDNPAVAPTGAGLMDEAYGRNLASGNPAPTPTPTPTPAPTPIPIPKTSKKSGSKSKKSVGATRSGVTVAGLKNQLATTLAEPVQNLGTPSQGSFGYSPRLGGNNLDFLNDLLPLLAAGGLGYMLAK